MHEPQFCFTLARLIEILDPSTYLDIGGYVGYFTILPMAWLRPDARIFCVEVNRRFCLLTRHPLSSTSHLIQEPTACGSERSMAKLTIVP